MISVYTFEDDDGNEVMWTTQSYAEAEDYARRNGYLLIERQYEYSDSDYLADYRSAEAQRAHPVAGLSDEDADDPDDDTVTA
jgi:TPP-dependent pyruvate/acetoin dehydrogenase alpha subunit